MVKKISNNQGVLLFYEAEMNQIVEAAGVFRDIFPNSLKNQSGHPGEEGRWTEALISKLIKNHLPVGFEVSTGFIWDVSNDIRSYQVDIIIHEPQKIPPIFRYGDAVIVHPDAVLAAMSVKYKLRKSHLNKELSELLRVADICNQPGKIGPYIGLLGFYLDADISKSSNVRKEYTESIVSFYKNLLIDGQRKVQFSMNELIDTVMTFDGYLLHADKGSPLSREKTYCKYIQRDISDKKYPFLIEILNGIYKRFGEPVTLWPKEKSHGIEFSDRIDVVRYSRRLQRQDIFEG